MKSKLEQPSGEGTPSRWTRLLAASHLLLGIELAPVGHIERLVSTLGGMIAIAVLITMERQFVGDLGAALLVASMGASAVLLFAVPHGALAQPWAVVVGHAVSAVIGVTCARFLPDPTLAAAAAVGLSIGAMHYLRAIHPPGGATALTAVVGGPGVHALGYQFVLTPVLLNALIMVAVAIIFNAAFAWRRYPAALGKRRAGATRSDAKQLTHADFTAALSRIGTFIDIDEEDFRRLQVLAQEAAESRRMQPDEIRLGACYSNGAFGPDWSVRRVIDEGPGPDGGSIIWRIVAGRGRNDSGLCSRREFAAWAEYEVVRSESSWIRARPGPSGNTD